MPVSENLIHDVAVFCNEKVALNVPILSTSYYYQSLPICVVDAVFSIGVRYAGVIKVVERFCGHENISTYRLYDRNIPEPKDQYLVSNFNKNFGEFHPQELAEGIFQNIQRTSTRQGILKAEAVQHWMKILENHNIDSFQDLDKKFQRLDENTNWIADFEKDIKKIKGQSSGISLDYFYMLAGKDSLVKPDRWIMRFLWERFNDDTIPVSGAIEIIEKLVIVLRNRFSHTALTVRELDHAIWKYQRAQPTSSYKQNQTKN